MDFFVEISQLSIRGMAVFTGRIAAKRPTAGIKFTHRPKIRFFLPRGAKKPDFWPVSKFNTGSWALRRNSAVKTRAFNRKIFINRLIEQVVDYLINKSIND